MTKTYDHLPNNALSIRQPWAWAILNAGKRIENRSKRTHYRGLFCIHASLSTPSMAYFSQARDFIISAQQELGQMRPDFPRDRINIERGGIIATAEITDCISASADPWFMGPFGWVLTNVQPIPFVPVKGALGLFDWKNRLLRTQDEA